MSLLLCKRRLPTCCIVYQTEPQEALSRAPESCCHVSVTHIQGFKRRTRIVSILLLHNRFGVVIRLNIVTVAELHSLDVSADP